MPVICVLCQTAMRAVEGGAGVVVAEMYNNPPEPYKIWMADELKCPGCGTRAIGRFGEFPIAAFPEEARKRLSEILVIGKAKIFYWHEQPRREIAIVI